MSNGVDDNSQVRGHAGDPGNKRCAQLAVQAAQQADLPIDQGCESPTVSTTTYTELSTKEDYMPTFDQVPLQEVMLKTATGKTAQITQEYLGYIGQLTEGRERERGHRSAAARRCS